MQEIRFSQPQKSVHLNEQHQSVAANPKPKNSILVNFLKIIFGITIVALILILFFWRKEIIEKKHILYDGFSAVFLTNGQVYFGKIIENNSEEMILNKVFYLQVGSVDNPEGVIEALNQTRFNLVKLGNELHGPTDELFINKSQIVFYEKLRNNSKVVESIKNYK